MVKKLFFACLFFSITLFCAAPYFSVWAKNYSDCLKPSSSACLKYETKADKKTNFRLTVLRSFLNNYQSDLAAYSSLILRTSSKYNLPWALTTAIAGVETGFCRNFQIAKSYNCWGFNNGSTTFENYPQAIETVSRTLKENYFDKNLTSPYTIGPIYAPPAKNWANNVIFFMKQLESYPQNKLLTLQLTL